MSGNPPGSPWRSTPNSSRARKAYKFTLSDEASEALTEMATLDGDTRSGILEVIILAELERTRKG